MNFFWKHLRAHYVTSARLWEGIDFKEVICKIRYQELRSVVTPAHGDELLFVSASEHGYRSLTHAKG